MKKILIFMACLLLLCSCGKTEPTEIQSSEISSEAVRLIYLDDAYWYDTEEFSTLVPRCGTADGDIQQKVELPFIPKEDGTTNFEVQCGYQCGEAEDKIEVSMDGGFRIFKRIDTNRDLSKYTYCLKLSGRHKNAENNSALIVFCNDKDMTFNDASEIMFSSNGELSLSAYAMPIDTASDFGITLTAESVGKNKLSTVFIQSGGVKRGKLDTGAWYRIDSFDGFVWTPVTSKIPMPVWTLAAYLIEDNDQTVMDVDYSALYGELPKGTYRIVKEVTDSSQEKRFAFGEFIIE
ncbi:MAG: hypothetical protein IJN39_01410 [Clostridia bacterium]|nr:hypothetical protein [Clostridia bacterium]